MADEVQAQVDLKVLGEKILKDAGKAVLIDVQGLILPLVEQLVKDEVKKLPAAYEPIAEVLVSSLMPTLEAQLKIKLDAYIQGL